MKQKIISIVVGILLSATVFSVAATETSDRSNQLIKNCFDSNIEPLLDPGDVLFEINVESPTGDNQCLGVEFDGTYFWVTGGGANTDPNKLYKFDDAGTLIATYDQPGHSTGWGWRDLTFDGTYLYASVDNFVDQIDPATGNYTGVSLNGPENPNRALAYDPATDHFWTANFGSPIYEFDRTGTVINTFAQSYPIYGLAWDDVSPDGPFLWVYDQTDEGGYKCHIRQFDPVAGVYTGVEYAGVYHDAAADVAGGAAFYEDAGTPVFVGLTQNTPDLIFGMDVSVATNPVLEITDIAGPIGIKATIKNTGTGKATNVDWDITLTGGLIILGKAKNGTIPEIDVGASGEAKLPFVLGFGKTVIGVEVTCTEGAMANKDQNATVLLIFVIPK